MNPETYVEYTNITQYILVNTAPSFFAPVQDQVNGFDILTGTDFSVTFDPFTFIDVDGDALTYDLKMQDPDLPLIAWLQLDDLNLSGNPPNQLGLSVDLVLIASDGYKTCQQSFTLTVKPSPSFIISIIASYVGPIIGALGAYIYAIRIYNIVCKKRYTFPRTFSARPGILVTDAEIYAVGFVGEHSKEANKILKGIRKLYSKEKLPDAKTVQNKKSSNLAYLTKLLTPNGEIDNVILTSTIETLITKQQKPKKTEIYDLFQQNKNLSRETVLEIIKDKLYLEMLACNPKTQALFERIKPDYANLVEIKSSKPAKNQSEIESLTPYIINE